MPIPLGVLAVAGAGGVVITGAGFIGGGFDGTPANARTSIYKNTFATDTISTSSATLPEARFQLAAMANSGVAGYFMGGLNNNNDLRANVYKLTFTGESMSTLATGLSASTRTLMAFANSGTAGYSAGGVTNSGLVTTVNKFTFSNDSRSTLGTGLSTGAEAGGGFANSGTAGYVALALTSGGKVTTVDKFAFSNDSRSTLGTGLSIARQRLGAMADSGTAGYVAGGEGAGDDEFSTTVEKFAFSNDARSTIANGLPAGRQWISGYAKVGVAGYFTPGNQSNNHSKIAFPSDTVSSIANLPVTGIWAFGACADSGVL